MSDEDIIRIANQAGWDVQNLDDGFGERLRRFAQDLERQPLYTAPPKREWVGLTDEDIHDAFNFTEVVKQLSWDREPVRWCENFSAYIEAKLKEKNKW
jgi:hypothetical protein